MEIEYIIVSSFVIGVIVWQIITYLQNESRIKSIKNLFPDSNDTSIIIDNEEEGDDGVMYLENEGASEDFKNTLRDLNSYLTNNTNKTFDYQIIKEIVNRNSRSLEDEVDTMLTVPLYLGLIATIFGIAFGIILFAWDELDSLLNVAGNIKADGIKVLLIDVGIAMFASLVGVFCTQQSTSHFNAAKTHMDKNKNRFLTWIQTDLMSKLSDDISGALIKMTQDLNKFNRTFSKNTQELQVTLSTVKNNYEGQVKLLQAIDKIKINKIAQANIDVYDKLQGCTDELEKLFKIIANSDEYVSKVVELNNNIGSIEERTRLFEELGQYFKNEIEFVRDRQGMMRQQMSSIDSVLQNALGNIGESLANSIGGLTQQFQKQNSKIELLIEEQQNALLKNLEGQQKEINERIAQIDNPFDGLKEIFEEGIKGIKNAFEAQNITIQQALSSQIETLKAAIEQQQQAIIRKLQETPGQLQAISELAKVLDRLSKSLDNTKLFCGSAPNNSVSSSNKNGFWRLIKSAFVPVCAFGSFISLLVLLILQIMELSSK